VTPPSIEEMRAMPKRLAFYARPEKHAARNMIELGVMALADVACERHLDGWELFGIGSQTAYDIDLLGFGTLKVLERQPQDEYKRMLGGYSVGLALMYTPHPSLIPVEMAAAGMVVVTNTFENKTAESLAAISQNLIGVEPTLEGVKAGLRNAIEAAEDYEARLRGSEVNWARSWEESLGEDQLRAVRQFIEMS
jgi:hypothetical protein